MNQWVGDDSFAVGQMVIPTVPAQGFYDVKKQILQVYASSAKHEFYSLKVGGTPGQKIKLDEMYNLLEAQMNSCCPSGDKSCLVGGDMRGSSGAILELGGPR